MADRQVVETYEVTLVVKVSDPLDGPPSTWDWPGLTDMPDEEIEFVAERFVGSAIVEVD